MTVDTKKLRELAVRMTAAIDSPSNDAFEKARFEFRCGTGPDVILALCDRLEAAERDAKRYRWLRAEGCTSDEMFHRSNVYDANIGEGLDRVIDALSQTTKEG